MKNPADAFGRSNRPPIGETMILCAITAQFGIQLGMKQAASSAPLNELIRQFRGQASRLPFTPRESAAVGWGADAPKAEAVMLPYWLA
jgi:hypothetical protein